MSEENKASATAPAVKKQSIFDIFETDSDVETKGVLLRYSDTIRILVARAGGSNKKFERLIKNMTKPHRQLLKAMSAGTASDSDAKVLEGILQEAYSQSVVLGWEGITERDGTVIECTPANVKALFERIPQLWNDIRDFAANYMNYLAEDTDEVAKN